MIHCYSSHELLAKRPNLQQHDLGDTQNQNQNNQHLTRPEVQNYYSSGQCLACHQQLGNCTCNYQHQQTSNDFYQTQTQQQQTRDSKGSSRNSSPSRATGHSYGQQPSQQQQQMNSSQISATSRDNHQVTQQSQQQLTQSQDDELYERLYGCERHSDHQWATSTTTSNSIHLDHQQSQQQLESFDFATSRQHCGLTTYRTQQPVGGGAQENLKAPANTTSSPSNPTNDFNNNQNQEQAGELSFASLVPIIEGPPLIEHLAASGSGQSDQRASSNSSGDDFYHHQQQNYTSGGDYLGCYATSNPIDNHEDNKQSSPGSSSSTGSLARATPVEQEHSQQQQQYNYQTTSYQHQPEYQSQVAAVYGEHDQQQATLFQDYYTYSNCDSTLTSGGEGLGVHHAHHHLQHQQSHSYQQQLHYQDTYQAQFLETQSGPQYDHTQKNLYQLASSEQQQQQESKSSHLLLVRPLACSPPLDYQANATIKQENGAAAVTQSGTNKTGPQQANKLGSNNTISTPTSRSRRGRPRKKGSHSKGKVSGKLWEFIRDLLLSDRTNPSFIRWERREDGVFKFVQSDKVAKMWGERKQNPKMTYEKLSRAMRYYYKSKVLLPVFGRRLVYKFGPNATGWMSLTMGGSGGGKGIASTTSALVVPVHSSPPVGSSASSSSSLSVSSTSCSSSAESSPTFNHSHLKHLNNYQMSPLQQQPQQPQQQPGSTLETITY